MKFGTFTKFDNNDLSKYQMFYINKNVNVTDGNAIFKTDKNIKEFTLIANILYNINTYSASVTCYFNKIIVTVYKGTDLYTGTVWLNISGIIKYQ